MGTTPDAVSSPLAALRWLAAVALVVALAIVTAKVARAYPVSSDDATGVLEAGSVLRGNLLLNGWALSNVSFITTDLPFYVAAVALRGPSPSLMRKVPAVIHAVAVAVAAMLARGRLRGVRGVAAVAVVVVLLGMPAGGLAEFVTKGYTRVGTTMGLFAALLALDPQAGCRVSTARLMLFAALLTLTLLADTYTLVIGASAVLAVCVRGGFFKMAYENIQVGRVALAVVVSVATAQGLAWLIGAVGGYTVAPLPLRDYLPFPDPLRVVLSNAGALAANLPSVYRCDLPTAMPDAVRIGCLIGPALLLLALAVWFRARLADFVSDVLVASMLLGLLAYLGSGNAKDRGTIRYMIPFVLSGSVLTARVLASRLRDVRPMAVLVLLGLSYAVTLADDLRKPPADDPALALAQWLESHDLRHGYGPYWDASIVTASSGGRVAVRPVRGRPISRERLVIEPFRWMTDARWYREGPATFVVFRPNPGPKYHFLINERTCAACFGPPSARYAVGPYVVLVWDRDLRPLLVHGLPWVP